MNSDDEKEIIDLTRPFSETITRDLRTGRSNRLTGESNVETVFQSYKAGSNPFPMLEIRMKGARGFVIPYSYVRGMEFNFSSQEIFTIYTAVGTFKLTGYNLSSLKEKLREHKVDWIREITIPEQNSEDSTAMQKHKEADNTVIESITYQAGSE